MMHIILTVADHEQNGFVALARWPNMTEADARSFLAMHDALIDDESEPDIHTASFTFILDLMDGYDCLDTGKRLLPTQIAMSLAPVQVRKWLDERPVPDLAMNRAVPTIPFVAARAFLDRTAKEGVSDALPARP